jgi:hypothetical protein
LNVRAHESLLDCALWIRAAERIDVPADPLVPGPLDVHPLPDPTVVADAALGAEWLRWWWSLVDSPDPRPRPPLDPAPEPAYDTPDPLGLARLPALRSLVAQRWPEARRWHAARLRDERGAYRVPSADNGHTVGAVEREFGRRLRPFHVEFVLLPVRDDAIRRVDEHRYLVPERVYGGPAWSSWLRELVRRIG